MDIKINFEKKTMTSQTKLLFVMAGFALLASQALNLLGDIVSLIQWNHFPFTLLDGLYLLATIGLGAFLIIGMSNVCICIPLCLFCLIKLVELFKNIGIFFRVFPYGSFVTYLFPTIFTLLQLVGCVLLLGFALGLTLEHSFYSMVSKIWFLPGLLLLVPNILSLFANVLSSFFYGYMSWHNIFSLISSIVFSVAFFLLGKCLADCLTGTSVADNIFSSITPLFSSLTGTEPTSTSTTSPIKEPVSHPMPETSTETAKNSLDSLSEELEKYKSLYENGLITEEDFSAKKKQILGL